jgi:hypothetical protein
MLKRNGSGPFLQRPLALVAAQVVDEDLLAGDPVMPDLLARADDPLVGPQFFLRLSIHLLDVDLLEIEPGEVRGLEDGPPLELLLAPGLVLFDLGDVDVERLEAGAALFPVVEQLLHAPTIRIGVGLLRLRRCRGPGRALLSRGRRLGLPRCGPSRGRHRAVAPRGSLLGPCAFEAARPGRTGQERDAGHTDRHGLSPP